MKLEAEQEEGGRLREMRRLHLLEKRFDPSSENWNQNHPGGFNDAEAEPKPDERGGEIPEEVEIDAETTPSKKARRKCGCPLPD